MLQIAMAMVHVKVIDDDSENVQRLRELQV
jgi:hypothetical protein